MSELFQLRTGLQGVNRLFSDALQPASVLVVPSQAHNYKTAFCVDLLRHAAIHSEPAIVAQNKTPTVIYFSFEESPEIIGAMLKHTLANNNDIEIVSPHILNTLVNGVTIHPMYPDPKTVTVSNLIKIVESRVAVNAEVKMIVIDMFDLAIDPENINLMVKYCKDNNITLVLPVSCPRDKMPEVDDLNKVTMLAVNDKYVGKEYLAGLVDVELYLQLGRENDNVYLTMQVGKFYDRSHHNRAEGYCFYQLNTDEGAPSLLDDIHGDDFSMRKDVDFSQFTDKE